MSFYWSTPCLGVTLCNLKWAWSGPVRLIYDPFIEDFLDKMACYEVLEMANLTLYRLIISSN
jgi:hypothetical protein